MALDEDLINRMRTAAKDLPGISENQMMGGICFFHKGNMLAGCSVKKTGERQFMFRVGKDNEEIALSRAGAIPVILGKRRMGGMVFVDEKVCDQKNLKSWLDLAMEFVGDLPAK